MTLDPVRSDPRRGGAVKRYHTWPTVQGQTVAEHSWNVLRILVTIWPEAPREAILYAEFHDTPEVATGDPPYPIKADNPDLKSGFDRLEHEAAEVMDIAQHLCPDAHWRNRVKLCDVLEMWEFGLDEQALGSRFAGPIVRRMAELRIRLTRDFGLSDEEIGRIRTYENSRTRRQP